MLISHFSLLIVWVNLSLNLKKKKFAKSIRFEEVIIKELKAWKETFSIINSLWLLARLNAIGFRYQARYLIHIIVFFMFRFCRPVHAHLFPAEYCVDKNILWVGMLITELFILAQITLGSYQGDCIIPSNQEVPPSCEYAEWLNY